MDTHLSERHIHMSHLKVWYINPFCDGHSLIRAAHTYVTLKSVIYQTFFVMDTHLSERHIHMSHLKVWYIKPFLWWTLTYQSGTYICHTWKVWYIKPFVMDTHLSERHIHMSHLKVWYIKRCAHWGWWSSKLYNFESHHPGCVQRLMGKNISHFKARYRNISLWSAIWVCAQSNELCYIMGRFFVRRNFITFSSRD